MKWLLAFGSLIGSIATYACSLPEAQQFIREKIDAKIDFYTLGKGGLFNEKEKPVTLRSSIDKQEGLNNENIQGFKICYDMEFRAELDPNYPQSDIESYKLMTCELVYETRRGCSAHTLFFKKTTNSSEMPVFEYPNTTNSICSGEKSREIVKELIYENILGSELLSHGQSTQQRHSDEESWNIFNFCYRIRGRISGDIKTRIGCYSVDQKTCDISGTHANVSQ